MPGKIVLLVAANATQAITELEATSAAVRRVDAAAASSAANTRRFSNGLRTGARVAGVGLLALGYGIKKTLDAAGTFQQQINVLGAVSGSTGRQLNALSKEALQLGKDAKLPATSAQDAAEAMVELSKAGLSVRHTMAAARPVLQLAAAAQVDNATAATIAATALNSFHLAGTQTAHVADLLAGAANASAGSITDMAEGMQFAGSAMHAAGQSIDDTTTAIALMSNAGLSGSVAGSSLAQAFRALQAPTAKAQGALDKYHISLFNSRGEMLKMPDLVDQFSSKLGGLTQKQQNQTLAQIFGTRAVQAARIVFLGGADAYDKMSDSVTKAGSAQKLAEAQTKGYTGAMNAFRSTVETLAISIGTKLLPAATSFAREANSLVGVLDANQGVGLKVVATFAALAASVVTINAGYRAYRASVEAATIAQTILNKTVLANPYVAFGAALAAVAVFVLTTRDNTNSMSDAFDNAKRSVDSLTDALNEQKAAHLDTQQAIIDQKNAAARLGETTDHVTELVRAGKKGTKEYGQALRDQNQAEIDLQRAQIRRSDATEHQRQVDSKARGAIARLGDQMGNLTQAANKQSREVNHLGGRWDGWTHNVRSRSIPTADEYSRRMDDLAGKLDAQARKYDKLNPRAAASARRFAGAARAAGNFAAQLHDIPDEKHLNFYISTFTTNMGNLNTSGRGRSLPRGTPGNQPGERALGGAVPPNTPFWVGETGKPELFVPTQAGKIFTSDDVKIGGGGYTDNRKVTLNISTRATIPAVIRADLGRQLLGAGLGAAARA